MKLAFLFLFCCAVVFSQGLVYNPFTKRMDKVGAPGPPGPPGGTGILDESAPLPAQPNINFVGTGVTCVDNPGLSASECTIPTPPAAVQTIFDEGVALTQRPNLKFIGAAVTCVDAPGTASTDCTVTGGGGGGGLNSLTGNSPILVGGTLTDPTLSVFWPHTGTVNTSTYTMLSTDNGKIKRFGATVDVAVDLPTFTVPYVAMFFNDGTQPVTVTISGTATDINGDSSFTLQPQGSALLSAAGTPGSPAIFYRGITTVGWVSSGPGIPGATACNAQNEVGKMHMRNDAAAANSSFYICSNTGSGAYGWEGPFAVGGGGGGSGATQFSELNDFKCIATSGTVLTVTPGSYAIGNYPSPSTIGGTITFSGGSGLAVVYVDEQSQLVTEAATGITQAGLTGQMTFTTATSPVVPDTAVPVCSLTVTAGAYTITSSGHAARVRNSVNKAGNGLLKEVSNGRATFSVDPAVVCLTTGNCTGGGGGSVTLTETWMVGGTTTGTTCHSNVWTPTTAGTDTDGVAVVARGTNPHQACDATMGDTENTFFGVGFWIPTNWTGGAMDVKMMWRSSPAAAGTALLRLYTACVASNEANIALPGPTYNTPQNFSGTTVTTSEFEMFATLSNITLTGCSAGEMLYLRVKRERSDAGDTMDADSVFVTMLQLSYPVSLNP